MGILNPALFKQVMEDERQDEDWKDLKQSMIKDLKNTSIDVYEESIAFDAASQWNDTMMEMVMESIKNE